MRLTHNDRKAIIIIAGALLLLNVALWIFRTPSKTHQTPSPLPLKGESSYQPASSTPFPFDPNTADSATFVELGLTPRVARAIVHYRAAGGIFRKPQDFARIYSLSDKDFRRLLPYIYIKESNSTKQETHPTDTLLTPPIKGGEEGTAGRRSFGKLESFTLSLSSADTAELRRIPGIGSYYSAKIVKYRERLGGFVSLSQLAEIEGLPENIAQWFTLGDTQIRKLPINTGNFGQLLRHPYLNFEQVRAIMNYRKAYGALHSLSDLKAYSAFTDSDFQRLKPYVAF